MIEIYKTNVNSKSHATKIAGLLMAKLSNHKINFDLHDRDKILRIESSEMEIEMVESVLKSTGISFELIN